MEPKKARKTIVRSHERSAGFGIDPEEGIPRIMLGARDLDKKRMKNQDLLDISRPYMDELDTFLGENHGNVIILTDRIGVILEVSGDSEDVKKAAALNLKTGANMDEKSIGTNAMGTAIREGRAVQVRGSEHFVKAFQRWSCSAAPIYDTNNEIVGTLNLTSDEARHHPYTLGLVGATVKAIESRIHNSSVQKQLYDAQQYAFSIMNHLSFGLIAIDLKGMIHWVNDTACRSLNIRRTRLINREISGICPQWDQFRVLVEKDEQILDEEGELNTRNASAKYLLNAYSIYGLEGVRIGYVLSFRPLSRMLRLINKYQPQQLSFTFDKIICKGKKMKKLVNYARTIAHTPSTVLITGESGTGKEVFAQSIHNASDRKNNAFIAINCGAISSSLIESELFGYEEGAFTGASKGGKPGKFELAHQGTLFLDEIGEMTMEMQVKLLRVLQDKTITRVGGSKTVKVDVRLIAASNKDLGEEVKMKRFRQDLFYRLSVIPLELPPLRERKMDIPPLYHYLLEQKASKLDRPIPPTENRTMQQLVHHDWPGNIRELENFAEKAVILSAHPEQLFPGAFPEDDPGNEEEFLTLKDKEKLPSMAQVEKAVIEKYLEHFDNHITLTAQTLGMGRNTLYQKIGKYGIRV
jgi:sigma-54 dependent transcriptional regulator, acetoin dehydrogenase operon transcriptional activator AcoR